MNKTEAKEILARELIHLQTKCHKDLQKLINSPDVIDLTGPSGISYQIEVQAFWDNPRNSNGALRIIASIDDGGFFSALIPLSADFIMDPDGKVFGI